MKHRGGGGHEAFTQHHPAARRRKGWRLVLAVFAVVLLLCCGVVFQRHRQLSRRLQPSEEVREDVKITHPSANVVSVPPGHTSTDVGEEGPEADEAHTMTLGVSLVPWPNGAVQLSERRTDGPVGASEVVRKLLLRSNPFVRLASCHAAAPLVAGDPADRQRSVVFVLTPHVDPAFVGVSMKSGVDAVKQRSEALVTQFFRLHMNEAIEEDYTEEISMACVVVRVTAAVPEVASEATDGDGRAPPNDDVEAPPVAVVNIGVSSIPLTQHTDDNNAPPNSPVSERERESYSLCFSSERALSGGQPLAVVEASTPIGLLNGLRTLMDVAHSLAHAQNSPSVFPVGCISRDLPKVPWRGLHLDTSRHFHHVHTIRNVLRAMSRLKLNRFHWHLSDDQGWRLESRRYPGLHTAGGRRGAPLNGRKVNKYNGLPYAEPAFHTHHDVKAVLAFAAKRGIVVVPEIDLPAHAAALIRGLSQHGDVGKRVGTTVNPISRGNEDCGSEAPVPAAAAASGPEHLSGAPNCMGGTFGVIHPTRDAVHILSEILGEVCAAFDSSPYVHLGGDEAEFIRDGVWSSVPCDLPGCAGLTDQSEIQAVLMDALVSLIEDPKVCPPAPHPLSGMTASGGIRRRRGTPRDAELSDLLPGLPERAVNPVGGAEEDVAGAAESISHSVARRAIVWDETIVELRANRVPKSPRVMGMLWRDDRVTIERVEQQYHAAGVATSRRTAINSERGVNQEEDTHPRLILTPKTRLYFDYVQYAKANRFLPMQRPPLWAKYKAVSIKRAFFTHIMCTMEEWQESLVYGVEGCLWTELIPNATVLEYQLFPRIYALADAAWTLRRREGLQDGFELLVEKLKRRHFLDVLVDGGICRLCSGMATES